MSTTSACWPARPWRQPRRCVGRPPYRWRPARPGPAAAWARSCRATYGRAPAATYPGRVVLAPEGRRMLRLEARNSQVPIERKPPWIKTRLRTGPSYTELKSLVRREGLHTVCEEAGCPNIFECWEDREATFLIGGDQCTRRCDFCQIDTGKPEPLDRDEPRRVAERVRQIHELNPDTGVENLIPDFNGVPALLREVFESRPEVLAHNVETVPRTFKRIRPAFRYDRSLDVITQARDFGLVTKSNLILGMGETAETTRAS